eukprot:GHVT01076558.1.p1 GENE.GHVT01076558.1~~GHVT01076558.1.p1  ORF type:complete len:156 (-),score=42.19 GHVT01076558.1:1909-2376(-)
MDGEERNSLKLLLLRRAIGVMPWWKAVSSDLDSKWRLYSRGLIDKGRWEAVTEAREVLRLEIAFLTAEAEHLSPDWGSRILREAGALYRHQMQRDQDDLARKEEEKQKERMEKQKDRREEQEKKEAEEKKIAVERKAAKMAEQLIKEANRGTKEK